MGPPIHPQSRYLNLIKSSILLSNKWHIPYFDKSKKLRIKSLKLTCSKVQN